MVETILVAAFTALIMCFLVSLIEDFVQFRRSGARHRVFNVRRDRNQKTSEAP